MADGFDIVTIRVDDERGVVAPTVLGAQPGCTVVFGTGLQGSTIELVDLVPTLGHERNVEMSGSLAGLVQAQ